MPYLLIHYPLYSLVRAFSFSNTITSYARERLAILELDDYEEMIYVLLYQKNKEKQKYFTNTVIKKTMEGFSKWPSWTSCAERTSWTVSHDI